MTIIKSKYQTDRITKTVMMWYPYIIDLSFGTTQAICTIDIYIYTCRHHKIIMEFNSFSPDSLQRYSLFLFFLPLISYPT